MESSEKKEPDKEPEKQADAKDKVLEKTSELYQRWNRLSSINADDPLWLGAIKIGIRILGILFLLAISPFVLLGLFLGIVAAG